MGQNGDSPVTLAERLRQALPLFNLSPDWLDHATVREGDERDSATITVSDGYGMCLSLITRISAFAGDAYLVNVWANADRTLVIYIQNALRGPFDERRA